MNNLNSSINWSDEQKTVFNWFVMGTGNAIIEAFAGAAKTSTIVEGLNRSNCVNTSYFVFNKKNQLEAEKKILNKKVTVKTFHSEGYNILKKAWGYIKGNPFAEFNRVVILYDNAPKQVQFQAARLVGLLKNLYVNPSMDDVLKTIELRDIDIIQKHKAEGWTNEKLAEMALKVLDISKQKPRGGEISFDDMLWLPVVLGIVQPTYNLITCDEGQDMNEIQFLMVQGLIQPGGKICIVGDRLQSIYYFRGAVSDGMEIFKQKLNAKTFKLTTTYRCPKRVVELAQTYAPDMCAAENAIEGEINTEILSNLYSKVKPLDFILSRTNAPLTKVCLNLLRKGQSAYIEGRDIGKNLITTIENIVSASNANNVPEFLNGLDNWLAARMPIKATPKALQAYANSQDEAETIRAISEGAFTIEDIKNKINSLFIDSDYVKKPSVVCLTVHKSKGRETENVFILNGSFGSGRRQLSPEEVQQETNINYVARTRCKKTLTMVNDD